MTHDPYDAMPENPYPAVTDRLGRLESRIDKTETTVASIVTITAVHTEQLSTVKGDMLDIANTFKEASDRTNKRIDRVLAAAWALVVVLLPIAYSLITHQ